MILPLSFYIRTDTILIAKELLGTRLVSRIHGIHTSGIITETEAYCGISDRASHAYGGKRTNRTAVMYQRGGIAYVYLCYGMHSLFNVVTSLPEDPQAVLIRGILPDAGVEEMIRRSGKTKMLSLPKGDGPGKVSRLLGIQCNHSGMDLTKPSGNIGEPAIWLEKTDYPADPSLITATPRIGVDYAGEDAALPYRFILTKKAAG